VVGWVSQEQKVEEVHSNSEVFNEQTEEIFSFLQVMTAAFASFAHGSNDAANAIAPFATIVAIYIDGKLDPTASVPWWILLLGAGGIVLGFATWGYKVIKTIGENLTKMTPSRGFNIEFATAFTVIVSSRLGIPISTTHCQVGSVVGVGLTDGRKSVNWRLFGNIILSWLITLPFAGAVSAILYVILRAIVF